MRAQLRPGKATVITTPGKRQGRTRQTFVRQGGPFSNEANIKPNMDLRKITECQDCKTRKENFQGINFSPHKNRHKYI